MTRGVGAGNLKRLLADLGVPVSSGSRVYEAVPIARESRYRVGRDSGGNPVVLVATTDFEEAVALPDFEGRHLRINHWVHCSISVDDVKVEHNHFSVITCLEADELLKDRYFDAIETVLRSLGETPTVEEFRQVMAGLIELFRLATQPPRGTVQGLWAELWLIAHSSGPQALLDAWHAEPTDAYDFNSGAERLEVKSAGDRARRHNFSHRQLDPPGGTRAVICSVFVERAGRGLTISALIRRIRRRVNGHQAMRRLDHIVAGTLGDEWRNSVEMAFDAELAAESLRFYPVSAVPSLSGAIPIGVSDIRYRSDLSWAQALTRKELLRFGDLVAAAVPESF